MDFNPFTPKYPEWYSPCLYLEHTIQVFWGESVNDVLIHFFKPGCGSVVISFV